MLSKDRRLLLIAKILSVGKIFFDKQPLLYTSHQWRDPAHKLLWQLKIDCEWRIFKLKRAELLIKWLLSFQRDSGNSMFYLISYSVLLMSVCVGQHGSAAVSILWCTPSCTPTTDCQLCHHSKKYSGGNATLPCSSWCVCILSLVVDFYRAALYAGRSFLWASVRPSVCLSLCLSVCQTRELWQNEST